MPSSNILLFDANKANMMADEQYNTNTQRLNGVQSGIASSQLQNKTLYQVSLVAYAIAQIMNQNGLDANDTAAVSAFVANLSGTMLQKVADLATTQEAQAGVATGKWMSPALVKAAMDTYTSGKWLPLTGGTMTGNLILNADPTANLGAATKQYVDKRTNLYPNNIYTNLAWTYMGKIDTSSENTTTTFSINKIITEFLVIMNAPKTKYECRITLGPSSSEDKVFIADLIFSSVGESQIPLIEKAYLLPYNLGSSFINYFRFNNGLVSDGINYRTTLKVVGGNIQYNFFSENSSGLGADIDVYYI